MCQSAPVKESHHDSKTHIHDGTPERTHRTPTPRVVVVLYLATALQWGIIGPLNLVKVLLNTASPTAHLWVHKESETCQGQCGMLDANGTLAYLRTRATCTRTGIARTWATMFWSGQIAFSLVYLYIFLGVRLRIYVHNSAFVRYVYMYALLFPICMAAY